MRIRWLLVVLLAACGQKQDSAKSTDSVVVSDPRSKESIADSQISINKNARDKSTKRRYQLNMPFEKYPCEMYDGMPVPPHFASNPGSEQFRTHYEKATEGGVNFAGQYTLVTWGCGSGCQVLSLVDRANGNILNVPFTASMGVEFRKDSRLLIVNPLGESQLELFFDPQFPEYAKPAYYVWENGQFLPLPELNQQAVIQTDL